MAETNKYYYQYVGMLDNGGRCSQLPHVTVQEVYNLLAII